MIDKGGAKKRNDIKIFQNYFKEKIAVGHCSRISVFSLWLENGPTWSLRGGTKSE